MRQFVDGSLDRLKFRHPFFDSNTLFNKIVISFFTAFPGFKGYRNRCRILYCIQNHPIIFDIPVEFLSKFWQRLPFGLGNVENCNRPKCRISNFFLLRYWIPVRIHLLFSCYRIKYLNFLHTFVLVWCKNHDSTFTLFYMTF